MRFDGRRAGPFFPFLASLVVCASAFPQGAWAQARVGDDTYHLSADRLSGSATSDEDVYTAIHVTVEHGPTTVTGDSAHVYRHRELVEVMGNVKIVDGKTRMWGDRASYDRKSRVAILRGNVRIEEGSAKITGTEARFYRNENRSVIQGNPRMQDSTRTLTANKIDYDRAKDVVVATGNVVAVDRAESTTVQAGRVRFDRARNYAWATEQNPVLTIEEGGGKFTIVRGTSLEFDNGKRAIYATGNVQVERDKLRATGDRGEFYERENRALLLGKPRAWDEEGEVRGDTLDLRFENRRVSSVQVRPNATVRYEAKAERGRGERTEAFGDTVTLVNPDEETRHAVIVGHARSLYWPSSEDSAQGGRNLSSGDSIVVEFEKGRARRATVLGHAEGLYHMAAEGDTSRINQAEQVRYQGRRILFDVNKNKVEVRGEADVTYKELRLNAEKVTFDTKTERMRAEGNPVLYDAKDRIVGNTMTYDLSIRRGTVYGGKTTYEKGFYYGEQIRKVSQDVLDVRNGSYTTCDLEEPHYHFGSSKMKIILRDKVIAKPVVFYIKHVPVLALPFYIFPIRPGRHSGFQLPQVEFGSSSRGGKFIRNVGYYWAINDYLDATLWGDYYQDLQWVAHSQTRYQKRYKWSGEINSSFLHTVGSGVDKWDLFGRHYQILGPNFTLTGQANLTNSSTYLRDQTIGRSVLLRVQRLLSSQASLNRSWGGSSANLGFLRSQDLDPDPGRPRVQQQLPSASFTLNPRPIGHLQRGREPAFLPWLSSTVFGFRSTLLNERDQYFKAKPETTFTTGSLGQTDTTVVLADTTLALTGVLHSVNITDQRTLLGFLRVSPNMSYSEIFYTRDAAGNRNQRAGVWRGGVGVNTALYGNFRTSLGPLRAIRHVVTPSVAFIYQPSYPKLNYLDPSGILRPRFTGLTGIGLSASEARQVSFSLVNDVHVKWGDPAQPKLLNNLIHLATFGSYDMLAKRSGRPALSDLTTSLSLHPIEKGSIDMSFVHNPYDGKLLSFSASSGLFFRGVKRSQLQEEKVEQDPTAQAVQAPTGWAPPGLVSSDLPWAVSISLSHSGLSNRLPTGGYSRWSATTTGNASVGINPTQHWRVDYAAQYDVEGRKLTSWNYSVKRDLHCWEAQFTRSFSGGITEYYFKINVKNLPEVYYEQGSSGLRGFGGIQNNF